MLSLGLALAIGAASLPLTVSGQANPDGLLQIERSLERRAYDESTEALLTYFWPLMYEVDRLPDPPSPADIKASPVRTLILNYRLMMELHAFVYEPGLLEAYRGALDKAYDALGKYKDLLDMEEVTGVPTDSRIKAVRLARLNFALAPLRFNAFREDTKEFAYSRATPGRTLHEHEIPEIWLISGVRPQPSLNDAGNAASLARGVLGQLQTRGIQFGNIMDPAQEDHLKFVRRMLRDVLVLCDMYPSISERVAGARAPLAELIDEYGDVTDKLQAFQAAQAAGVRPGERADALNDEVAEAKAAATEVISSRSIQRYMDALTGIIETNRR